VNFFLLIQVAAPKNKNESLPDTNIRKRFIVWAGMHCIFFFVLTHNIEYPDEIFQMYLLKYPQIHHLGNSQKIMPWILWRWLYFFFFKGICLCTWFWFWNVFDVRHVFTNFCWAHIGGCPSDPFWLSKENLFCKTLPHKKVLQKKQKISKSYLYQ